MARSGGSDVGATWERSQALANRDRSHVAPFRSHKPHRFAPFRSHIAPINHRRRSFSLLFAPGGSARPKTLPVSLCSISTLSQSRETRLMYGSFAELSLRQRTNAAVKLTGSAGGDYPRRFAFSAFPARVYVRLIPGAALSVSAEIERGSRGTMKVPLESRESGSKLSKSLVITAVELTGGFLPDPDLSSRIRGQWQRPVNRIGSASTNANRFGFIPTGIAGGWWHVLMWWTNTTAAQGFQLASCSVSVRSRDACDPHLARTSCCYRAIRRIRWVIHAFSQGSCAPVPKIGVHSAALPRGRCLSG